MISRLSFSLSSANFSLSFSICGASFVIDFIDANVARGLGDKIAFTDSERSLTYAELQGRSCRFATALKAVGLREETRVILSFHDCVGEFVVILDVSVVTKQFRYFQNGFRGRALAQFEDDQFGVKNFREQRGHRRIPERLIGLTG